MCDELQDLQNEYDELQRKYLNKCVELDVCAERAKRAEEELKRLKEGK